MDSCTILGGGQDARQVAFCAEPDNEYQHMMAHVLDIMALHQADQAGEDFDSLPGRDGI